MKTTGTQPQGKRVWRGDHFLAMLFLLLAIGSGIARADSSRIVATIGTQLISEGDIVRKMDMQRCYGDSTATVEHCFVMLASEALERAVLRAAYGLEPPLPALREKAAWIERNTRDPLKLHCVGAACGGDTLQYLRLFVSPTIVNPKLHALYSRDTVEHAAERDSIERLQRHVHADPGAMTSLPHDTASVPRHHSASDIAGAPGPTDNPLVDKVLAHCTPGEVWPAIVEDDNGYMIVRLDAISDSSYHITEFRVAKRPFDDWFRAYVHAHVPVHVIDPHVEEQVEKKYPTLWWLQR